MPTLNLDGDASGLIEATERAKRAVERLEAEMATKKFPLGSKESDRLAEQLARARTNVIRLGEALERSRAPVSRWEANIRSTEAAGRIFGGRMGEVTGAVGDFADIIENGLSPVGAFGLAITAVGVAAVGTVAGMVGVTNAAIEIANESDQMNRELRDAERAMAALENESDRLALVMGTKAAPTVASMTYALLGLVETAGDAASAFSEENRSSLTTALIYNYAAVFPKTTAAVYALSSAYEYLEKRGRAAADAQVETGAGLGLSEKDMLDALGLFEPKEVTELREKMREAQRREDERERREREQLRKERENDRKQEIARDIAANIQQANDLRTIRYASLAEVAEIERVQARKDIVQNAEKLSALSRDEAEAAKKSEEQAKIVAKAWESAYDAQRQAAFSAIDATLGMISDLTEGNREATIAMFILRKAAALAEIVINTQVAATRALAEGGPAGPALAIATEAAGAAAFAAVSAQSIAEGVSTFGGQGRQSQSQSNTYNLVVDSRTVRGAVRPHGAGSRRPAGQR